MKAVCILEWQIFHSMENTEIEDKMENMENQGKQHFCDSKTK